MSLRANGSRWTLWASALVFLLTLARAPAADTGPTLRFDYGAGTNAGNPLNKFMYFVALVSPQPVWVFTNAGNTQCARVLSLHCRTNGAKFHAVCDFELAGQGVQRNVIDRDSILRGHEKSIKAGDVLTHQLTSINVEGAGEGSVEVDGILTNGQPVATEVRLRFDAGGKTSPVLIHLEDFAWARDQIQPQNETVARVNQLAFRERAGKPEMEVTLASVKAGDAGNGFWANLVGGLKGMAANALLPPLRVAADGHQAMMDFGLALALGKPTFTFPFATRLKTPAPAAKIVK